jgi:hypothetical protein
MHKNFYIQCNNSEEFIFAQKYLFKNKYLWYSSGEVVKPTSRIYPIYLYDADNSDSDSLRFLYLNSNTLVLNKKLFDIKIEMRKEKLSNLDLL